MSTKSNPGPYDCYAKLADDEEYFVLRAKDPFAPALIELWVAQRLVQYGPYDKLDEAIACAERMREWKRQHPEAKPSVSSQPIDRLKDQLRTITRILRTNPTIPTSSILPELENLL